MNELIKQESLPLSSFEDLKNTGKLLAQSGMFGANNEAEGFVIASTCLQQGIALLDFIRTYHLIDNKPSMKSDAIAAEFRKRGGKYRIIERSATKAEAEFEFENNKITFSFSYKEAEEKGLSDEEVWGEETELHLWTRPSDLEVAENYIEEVFVWRKEKGMKPVSSLTQMGERLFGRLSDEEQEALREKHRKVLGFVGI